MAQVRALRRQPQTASNSLTRGISAGIAAGWRDAPDAHRPGDCSPGRSRSVNHEALDPGPTAPLVVTRSTDGSERVSRGRVSQPRAYLPDSELRTIRVRLADPGSRNRPRALGHLHIRQSHPHARRAPGRRLEPLLHPLAPAHRRVTWRARAPDFRTRVGLLAFSCLASSLSSTASLSSPSSGSSGWPSSSPRPPGPRSCRQRVRTHELDSVDDEPAVLRRWCRPCADRGRRHRGAAGELVGAIATT